MGLALDSVGSPAVASDSGSPDGRLVKGPTVLKLCSRCGEREVGDDPFHYCDYCSLRLGLEHEVDVHKARIAELEKLLATEASERETVLAAEVARLKSIFDDAGQGEANVLGLIDHYQDCILELEKRVKELSAAEEGLRRRIQHQRREIRMLHRLREMESVSARRGREIALARMYVPSSAIPDGAADAIRAAHHAGTLATVLHPDGSIWAVAWRAKGGA